MTSVLAGLVLAMGLGGAAQAATVTTYCPNAVPNAADSTRDFYVGIENTFGAAGCVATGAGNDSNSAAVATAVGSSILLDKSDGPSAVAGVVLTVLGATSGTWSIALPTGFTLTNAFISFKSGEAGGDPDWALFSIPTGILSGSWGFDDTQCQPGKPPRPTGCEGTQTISHASLYGTLVPSQVVPLPAAGLMLLGALGGLGLMRRRKTA